LLTTLLFFPLRGAFTKRPQTVSSILSPPKCFGCHQEDEESQAHRSLRRSCGDCQENWKSLFPNLLHQSPHRHDSASTKRCGHDHPEKEWLSPSLAPSENRLIPRKHQEGMELQVGEMVVMMDYPDAKDWYVAEVAQVLGDRFTVNGFTTTGAPLETYRTASRKDRVRALQGISFHRTWCKDKGKGEGTIIPPAHLKGREKYLWNWRIPIGEKDQLLLIRNVARRLGVGWMPEQGHQGTGGNFEVPPSRWSGRS
jgi:hypothetical protein